jgi:hypothetical protein
MISIIISSANFNLLSEVQENIKATIGLPYEVISFDNSQGIHGIAHVYNLCAAKAKFDLVCFIHEDIIIKTPNWGKIAVDIFNENNSLGLLGIAGTTYQPFFPSSWGHPQLPGKTLQYVNILQHFKFSDQTRRHLFSNPSSERLKKVATIDGVFFITKQQVLKDHQFDEQLLKRFHGYDVDFSLSVNKNFEVAITYDILIEHFSEGRFEREWLFEAFKIQNKWASHLPINVDKYSSSDSRIIERKLFKKLLKVMLKFDIPVKEIGKVQESIKNNIPTTAVFNMMLKYYYTEAKLRQRIKFFLLGKGGTKPQK